MHQGAAALLRQALQESHAAQAARGVLRESHAVQAARGALRGAQAAQAAPGGLAMRPAAQAEQPGAQAAPRAAVAEPHASASTAAAAVASAAAAGHYWTMPLAPHPTPMLSQQAPWAQAAQAADAAGAAPQPRARAVRAVRAAWCVPPTTVPLAWRAERRAAEVSWPPKLSEPRAPAAPAGAAPNGSVRAGQEEPEARATPKTVGAARGVQEDAQQLQVSRRRQIRTCAARR